MNTCQNNKKIKIENISKSFQDILVLDNISIEAEENEFVSILGASGSGKSTIFNIISGILEPDDGKVLIEGEDYTGKSGRVSYMYQKDLLLPWKKIIDNAAIPLIIKGKTKKQAREEAVKFFKIFGLEGFEYKYPHQLSGGMRQRAALLRTYLFSNDIMLLDEPFGALDALTRSKMHYWMIDVIRKLNTTVLFITHDIEEAIFLSDKIYIISDKPALIKEEVIINLPKERSRDIITTTEFNDIKKHILSIL